MPVMEPTLPNIPATLPFETYSSKQTGEDTALKLPLERNSNYMANMILPEMVQSSRNFPLGPDCIITYTEDQDQSLLLDMDLYWYISREKGCVECRVNVCNTGLTRTATTSDPRVIVTRKPRRFEAYCCSICRSNFVTVVQALLHVKAFHRQKKKILIQDQDVFHDIDKAMEVPPVPLPWYVAKKVIADQSSQVVVSTTQEPSQSSEEKGHPTSLVATSKPENPQTAVDGDFNPVTSLLQAIVKEYGKQVQTVLFGKDFSEVKVQFEDMTSVLARLPDLVSQESNDEKDIGDSDEKLEFKVSRVASESDDDDSCIVRMNRPILAQQLIISALKQGVSSQGAEVNSETHSVINDVKGSETSAETDVTTTTRLSGENDATAEKYLPTTVQIKLDSRGRPSKTVRFMVGSPDSDEDGSSSAGERPDRDETTKIVTDSVLVTDDKKTKEDEGLKGVVNKLISTADKGRIVPVEPTSPETTAAPAIVGTVRKEILATAAIHAQSLPKNHSVPNLSTHTDEGSKVTASFITNIPGQSVANTSGITRVQSWGAIPDSSQKFTLSTFSPYAMQKLHSMSRDELRKSFLTAGRAFTYAEKIKLMNKLNDEDNMITQAHVRGAGKLAETEAQSPKISTKLDRRKTRKVSTSSIVTTVPDSTQPASTPVITIVSGSATQENTTSPGATKRKVSASWSSDGRKKRKSKYDVQQFMKQPGLPEPDEEAKKRPLSGSEGSVSDYEEKEIRDQEQADDSETNPASFLDTIRAAYPAFLSPRRTSFPSLTIPQDVPGSYPTMLSSEYYGSGEWANAAMQTLQKLQTTMDDSNSPNLVPPKWEDNIKKEHASDGDTDSSSSSPFTGGLIEESPVYDSMKVEAMPTPVSPPEISRPNSDETILRLAKQIANDRMKSHAMAQIEDGGRSQRKRPVSPLVNTTEKATPKKAGNMREYGKKAKHEKQQKFTTRSSSDPNFRKRRSVRAERTAKSESLVADQGDQLEFISDVTTTSLRKNDKLTLRYIKRSAPDGGSTSSGESSMEMSQIFQNSVDTYLNVRYIEKVSVCRVCGFSLSVEDKESSMNSHVMEHSLKELLQSGCNGKQLM